jgi:hypothetical protein
VRELPKPRTEAFNSPRGSRIQQVLSNIVHDTLGETFGDLELSEQRGRRSDELEYRSHLDEGKPGVVPHGSLSSLYISGSKSIKIVEHEANQAYSHQIRVAMRIAGL